MKITITQEFDSVDEVLAFLAPHVRGQLGAGTPPPTLTINVAGGSAGTQAQEGAGAPAAASPIPPAAPFTGLEHGEQPKRPRKPRADAGKPRGPYKVTTNAEPEGAGAPAATVEAQEATATAASAAAPQAASSGEASSSAELTLEGMRDLLRQLNAAPGKGVMACTLALREFGVLRISELPKEKYAEFAEYLRNELPKAAA